MQAVMCLGAVAALSGAVFAATSFSNDLTSEAGLAPNLEIADTGDANRAVAFSAAGAQFGSAAPGNEGRNYIRTTAMDFDNVPFVAEMTADLSQGGRVFFGLGGGNVGTFGTPDWDVANTVWVEQGLGVTTLFTFEVGPGPVFQPNPLAVPGSVSFRLRMSYDAGSGDLTFEQDDDWSGGPFVADSTSTINVAFLFAGGEPGSLFVGGGSGAIVTDFDVTVIPAPAGTGVLALAGLVGMRRRR